MSTQIPFTSDHLLRMPDDGFRYELVRGELIRMSPSGFRHSEVALTLASLLREHVMRYRLGRVAGPDAGYVLSAEPETVRSPDVSFVTSQQIAEHGSPIGFWFGAPDLAIEVLSPSNTPREIDERVADYFAAGTRLIWIIDPESRMATIRTPDGVSRLVASDGELAGGDVVPGFRCRLAELFA